MEAKSPNINNLSPHPPPQTKVCFLQQCVLPPSEEQMFSVRVGEAAGGSRPMGARLEESQMLRS